VYALSRFPPVDYKAYAAYCSVNPDAVKIATASSYGIYASSPLGSIIICMNIRIKTHVVIIIK